MKQVEPIRDPRKLEAMKRYLKGKSARDFAFFMIGINSGLRISDLLELRIRDVLKEDGRIVDSIQVVEKKTTKRKEFAIGDKTKKAIRDHILKIGSYDFEDPLFFSRKRKDGRRTPITRQQAHFILSECAKDVGIEEPIGTHSLRKTFGYTHYKRGTDLSLLQDILNHSSPKITLIYIGIRQDEKNAVYLDEI